MSQGSELTGDGKTPPNQDVDSLAFEEAFRRLGEMAESLEQGGLTLADATARYQEGMDLVRRCKPTAQRKRNSRLPAFRTPTPPPTTRIFGTKRHSSLRLDLHVHTRFSKDSSAPIASVVRRCRLLGSSVRQAPRGACVAMLNVGWLSTGRGEGSLGLLRLVQDRILAGKLDARIQFVFSNRAPGEAEGSDRFFDQVDEYGLPLVTLSSAAFRRARSGSFAAHRDEYDRQVMDLLSPFKPDICVLAGYMLIVGGSMCRAYPLLNLHPALPDGPIGTWQEVVWRLIETRAGCTGAMIHLATEDVDRGPVVSHCTVPISGGAFAPLWEDLQRVWPGPG